jgi:hypothetical protein
MKDGLRHIVGKRIAAVVAAASPRPPHRQVFLVFDDGTRFEFWGERFSCCSGLDQAAGIDRYVKSGGGAITHAYGESFDAAGMRSHRLTTGPEDVPAYRVPPPENLQSLLERDWAAWEEAKAAIGKARKR